MLILFPIMGFCIPWPRTAIADRPRLRVMTCNIEGGLAARQALIDLVVAEQADLVALEEYDPAVPLPWPDGWHVVHAGQLLVAAPTSSSKSSIDSARNRRPNGRRSTRLAAVSTRRRARSVFAACIYKVHALVLSRC